MSKEFKWSICNTDYEWINKHVKSPPLPPSPNKNGIWKLCNSWKWIESHENIEYGTDRYRLGAIDICICLCGKQRWRNKIHSNNMKVIDWMQPSIGPNHRCIIRKCENWNVCEFVKSQRTYVRLGNGINILPKIHRNDVHIQCFLCISTLMLTTLKKEYETYQSKYDILLLDFDLNIFSLLPFSLHFMLIYGEWYSNGMFVFAMWHSFFVCYRDSYRWLRVKYWFLQILKLRAR